MNADGGKKSINSIKAKVFGVSCLVISMTFVLSYQLVIPQNTKDQILNTLANRFFSTFYETVKFSAA